MSTIQNLTIKEEKVISLESYKTVPYEKLAAEYINTQSPVIIDPIDSKRHFERLCKSL